MSLSGSDFELVRRVVYDTSGIVLDPGKEYLVESRLQPLCRHENVPSIPRLVQKLREPGAQPLVTRLVDAMTTNETSFFRDVEPFEALRRHVLPALIEARRATRQLNIWYAASSTGQEPYSVSMMLDAEFPQLRGWIVNQLATDISPTVLERARAGRYSQLEVNRGLPAKYLVHYFTKVGNDWRLKDNIRKMVRFEELNLIKAWPLLPAMDIVMLRNVMIYFDTEAKKRVLSGARRVLRPDGYLFLGGAETPMNLDDSFDRQPYPRAGCYTVKATTLA
ncbi:MAG: protein-glutamate O-methyltransferase CheR [Acidobacteria bacterium]|nr:protein-glutamate O-methyltransferase CheR [Acidobacteriota bacterium]